MNENKYKFKDEDFVIFKEGIFSTNKDNIFKELITNSYGKGLPIIPGVYFKENDENIGSKIINTYFTIDNNFKKLTLIKDMILNIIEINSYDFKKINVPRERYQLYDDNIIIIFKDSIDKTFKDKEKYGSIEKVREKSSTALGYNPLYYGYNKFIDLFIQNNYVLLKNNYDTLPTFLNIFSAEYKTENSDSKSYFLKLFQEYVDVRNVLLNYIKSDYGLLAFKFFFDINLAKDYKLQQNKLKKESIKNVNLLNNLSNYELFNNSSSNVKKNFELKSIFIKGSDETEYVLIEILEDQEYQYKLINNDGNIVYAKEDGDNLIDESGNVYIKKKYNKTISELVKIVIISVVQIKEVEEAVNDAIKISDTYGNYKFTEINYIKSGIGNLIGFIKILLENIKKILNLLTDPLSILELNKINKVINELNNPFSTAKNIATEGKIKYTKLIPSPIIKKASNIIKTNYDYINNNVVNLLSDKNKRDLLENILTIIETSQKKTEVLDKIQEISSTLTIFTLQMKSVIIDALSEIVKLTSDPTFKDSLINSAKDISNLLPNTDKNIEDLIKNTIEEIKIDEIEEKSKKIDIFLPGGGIIKILGESKEKIKVIEKEFKIIIGKSKESIKDLKIASESIKDIKNKLEASGFNISSIKISKPTQPDKIDKKLFVNKINKANFLYINLMSQDYYKIEQQTNINIYYNNLKTSIDNLVGNDIDNTLYGITKNSLETDFNTLKFIFNYVEQINFNKSVDIHFDIKKYISTKINNLEKNYGRYVDWYYKFIGLMSSNINRNGITSDSDFKTFFDKLFKDIEEVKEVSIGPIKTSAEAAAAALISKNSAVASAASADVSSADADALVKALPTGSPKITSATAEWYATVAAVAKANSAVLDAKSALAKADAAVTISKNAETFAATEAAAAETAAKIAATSPSTAASIALVNTKTIAAVKAATDAVTEEATQFKIAYAAADAAAKAATEAALAAETAKAAAERAAAP